MVKRHLCARLMGSSFELIVVAKDDNTAEERLRQGVEEISRLEGLLTEFNEDSQTSEINRWAGIRPVRVDAEVAGLVQRSLYLSKISQGAFDITSGILRSLYHFKERIPTLPEESAINERRESVGFSHVVADGNSVFLTRKGMRIGFGAIGKGFAADRVRTLWKAAGVTSGVVNASGDLTAWGLQADGQPWKIGIADPREPDRMLMWLPVEDAAIATSGNYEQFFEIGGVRYSHNLDPRTGRPVKDVKSVTIVSPSAELSDALATAVTVMGPDAGLHLLNQLPQIHGIVVDHRDRIFITSHIQNIVHG